MKFNIRFMHLAEGVSAQPTENNLRYFNVIITGPAGSPYEGM